MAFFGLLARGGIKVRPCTRWVWAGFVALPWVVFVVGLAAKFRCC